MKEFPGKFQAVVFANAYDITPQPETLTYFIEAFKDKGLIPATFQEIGNKGIELRFSLKSADDIWNIEFGTKRIDITKTNVDVGVSDMKDLKSFIADVSHINKVIFDKFPNKANRISLVTTYFSEIMKSNEVDQVFPKLFKTIQFYQENQPAEWRQRYTAKINDKINEKEEEINFISEIIRLRGNVVMESKDVDYDGIVLKFDINTSHDNHEFRFNYDDFDPFYNYALKWIEDMTEHFENFINI